MSDVERWHLLRFVGGEPESICARLEVGGELQAVPASWEALEVVESRHLESAVAERDRLRRELEGAVSLVEVCAFLRSATYPHPGTGRDRHINGFRAAADELERHFGGR